MRAMAADSVSSDRSGTVTGRNSGPPLTISFTLDPAAAFSPGAGSQLMTYFAVTSLEAETQS